MKVGIIGGGFGLTVQAPIINTHPKMKVTAISTMKRHQLPGELKGEKNTPAHYKDWTDMVNREELDLVFVSSIPFYHFKIVKYALEKGIKNIVCEKPFTMNSNESKELLKLSKQYKANVLIDFEWRYLPARQKVKELIMNHTIGDILHFEYHTSSVQYNNLIFNKRGWMGEKQKFGGMLGALGTHMIDCLNWLVNDEIEMINGLVHTHIPIGAGEQRDADDAFFIHGKMKNNCTFSIQLISGIHHGFGSSLRIFGKEGTITLTNDQQLCLGKMDEQLIDITIQNERKIPPNLSAVAISYYSAFYPLLEKLYEYIVYNKVDRDLPTIEVGHRNQVVLDAILAKSLNE
ncbi:Gfo/Idh/MocA family oxidoreductase [Bacillus sp. Bva_UNVM-123]|uniref:Gfo/Idh/MocA family protein n=1 Tax=Bacillus sp. Bva_UNVM-123 TaxID=2829798 RepID=UPI00391F2085